MSRVPSRKARLAHAAQHAELWNAGKKDEWVASWRTICPGEVRMFDPVGTAEKRGLEAATSEPFDMFQSLLRIKLVTVQVNGDEMAWVCEIHFGTERNVQTAYSIETFTWDDDGNLLIKTYYPMPTPISSRGSSRSAPQLDRYTGACRILAWSRNKISSWMPSGSGKSRASIPSPHRPGPH